MKIKANTTLDKLSKLSEELLEDCQKLRDLGVEAAVAENAMAKAKAIAFLKADGKNKETRESVADAGWAQERQAASIARHMAMAQLELVRSKRQILSAFQTFINSNRAEAEVYNFGQN